MKSAFRKLAGICHFLSKFTLRLSTPYMISSYMLIGILRKLERITSKKKKRMKF